MERVPAFKAIDGMIFLTEEACLAHELPMKFANRVDDYMASPANEYKEKAAATIARRAILGFLLHDNGIDHAQPELTLDNPAGTASVAAALAAGVSNSSVEGIVAR